MEKEDWRALILEAVQEARNGSSGKLWMLATLLEEANEAKQELRRKGYGWTGLGLLGTIQIEVPSAKVSE